MNKSNKASEMSLAGQGAKGTKKLHPYLKDKRDAYEFLKVNTATATMVAVALNIYRPNMCRIKRELETEGHLWELHRSICPITKCRASFLTTNIKLRPSPQPDLFTSGGVQQCTAN